MSSTETLYWRSSPTPTTSATPTMSGSPDRSTHSPPSRPSRSPASSPHARNPIVDRGLDIQLVAHERRYSLKWGTINVVLLSVVLFDLSTLRQSAFATPAWRYYAENAFAAVLTLSVLYHFGRYFYRRFSLAPVCGTVEQRRLLRFDDGDKSFVTSSGAKSSAKSSAAAQTSKNGNSSVSNLSWHSSFNESNRSIIPSSWLYNRCSPGSAQQSKPHHNQLQPTSPYLNHSQHSQNLNSSAWSAHNGSLNASNANDNAGSFTSPYKNYNRREIITDGHELQKYMKTMSAQKNNGDSFLDNSAAAANDANTLNTLRSYCNNAANLLKTSLYQMSPATVSPAKPLSSSSAKDDLVGGIFASLGGSSVSATATGGHALLTGGINSSGIGGAFDDHSAAVEVDESLELQRLLASGQLTQSIYNLRGWLSVTIVQRLDAEIDKTNRALSGNTQAECRGFTDVQIGKVGLERLRKTAEVSQLVNAFVPMLPKIVEFVQVSSNQEYLVQRIRELAKGCVLTEYRWNAGGSYNGLPWEDHLPTDATVMFHLFCTYLDGQLPPLPQPGGRPFYTRYVVHGDKRTHDEIKADVRNKSGCAILCTNGQQRPKFNFVTQRTIHSSVHDRNNLFYVIVEFLVYMRTHNEGMLENVNLGRSGINLLRVIGD